VGVGVGDVCDRILHAGFSFPPTTSSAVLPGSPAAT
jgi:hypothetical protein